MKNFHGNGYHKASAKLLTIITKPLPQHKPPHYSNRHFKLHIFAFVLDLH